MVSGSSVSNKTSSAAVPASNLSLSPPLSLAGCRDWPLITITAPLTRARSRWNRAAQGQLRSKRRDDTTCHSSDPQATPRRASRGHPLAPGNRSREGSLVRDAGNDRLLQAASQSIERCSNTAVATLRILPRSSFARRRIACSVQSLQQSNFQLVDGIYGTGFTSAPAYN